MNRDCLNFTTVDGDVEIEYYPVGSVYSDKHPVVLVKYNGEATISLIGIKDCIEYLQRQRNLFNDVVNYVQETYTRRKVIENKWKSPGF